MKDCEYYNKRLNQDTDLVLTTFTALEKSPLYYLCCYCMGKYSKQVYLFFRWKLRIGNPNSTNFYGSRLCRYKVVSYNKFCKWKGYTSHSIFSWCTFSSCFCSVHTYLLLRLYCTCSWKSVARSRNTDSLLKVLDSVIHEENNNKHCLFDFSRE